MVKYYVHARRQCSSSLTAKNAFNIPACVLLFEVSSLDLIAFLALDTYIGTFGKIKRIHNIVAIIGSTDNIGDMNPDQPV